MITNELDRLARKFGTDKRSNDEGENIYHDYVNIYYPYLMPRKFEFLNLLEIGVFSGASHRMWLEFFPNAKIFGIENGTYFSLEKMSFTKEEWDSGRLKIIMGDQSDKELIDQNFDDNSLDIVIDDGSHTSWHQQKSFKYLWPKLKSGGAYFIEDLAVCLIREFREFEDPNSATINWLQNLDSGNPLSYYFTGSESKLLMEEIKCIYVFGELGIVEKR